MAEVKIDEDSSEVEAIQPKLAETSSSALNGSSSRNSTYREVSKLSDSRLDDVSPSSPRQSPGPAPQPQMLYDDDVTIEIDEPKIKAERKRTSSVSSTYHEFFEPDDSRLDDMSPSSPMQSPAPEQQLLYDDSSELDSAQKKIQSLATKQQLLYDDDDIDMLAADGEKSMKETLEQEQSEVTEEHAAELREEKVRKRSTTPFMTKFEKARIVGTRALQISLGAPVMVEPEGETDVLKIAMKELREKKIPLIVRRFLPDGCYEDWRVKDLKL